MKPEDFFLMPALIVGESNFMGPAFISHKQYEALRMF
jgi:hypothetical protein